LEKEWLIPMLLARASKSGPCLEGIPSAVCGRTSKFAKDVFFFLTVTFLISAVCSAADVDLNRSIPVAAQEMVREGIRLRERDQLEAAAALFKKAITSAPNYVQAHVEYIRTRAFFQHQYDAVRAEYDALAARDPNNPVYPLVGALVLFQTPGKATQDAYEK